MANLSTNLRLETSGTIPTASLPFSNTLTLSGDLGTSGISAAAEYTTITLSPSASQDIFDSTPGGPPSETVYFYIQSNASNTDLLRVFIDTAATGTGYGVLRMAPGDFAYFPMKVNAGAGQQVTLTNLSASDSCTVTYLWAVL